MIFVLMNEGQKMTIEVNSFCLLRYRSSLALNRLAQSLIEILTMFYTVSNLEYYEK